MFIFASDEEISQNTYGQAFFHVCHDPGIISVPSCHWISNLYRIYPWYTGG